MPYYDEDDIAELRESLKEEVLAELRAQAREPASVSAADEYREQALALDPDAPESASAFRRLAQKADDARSRAEALAKEERARAEPSPEALKAALALDPSEMSEKEFWQQVRELGLAADADVTASRWQV